MKVIGAKPEGGSAKTYCRHILGIYYSHQYISWMKVTHFDNLDSLRLENIIDTSDDDGEINLIKPSLYYSIDNLPFHTKNHDRLNILSLNAQSINSKFDSLVTFLEIARKQNVYFHAICLKETWLSDQSDLSLFQIDGYRCFSQGKRCSPHGGLITYINSQLNASVIDIEMIQQYGKDCLFWSRISTMRQKLPSVIYIALRMITTMKQI